MIKSHDELNTCNDGHRGSEVLLATIEKCEALEKENERLSQLLKQCIPAAEFARDFGLAAMIKAVIGESEE